MNASSLLEILDCAYLSKFVETPFGTRGGILLIGPPETLRSTLIDNVFADYPDALVLSDTNVQQLIKFREDMAAGKITTLAFGELAKLYARNPNVARNIEGHLMALVEEGMSVASFQDGRMASSKAKVFVVAACTEKFYQMRFTEWMDSGFARRFLHVQYRLENPWILADAQEKRQLLSLDNISRKIPGNRKIAWIVEPPEMKFIRSTLKFQFRKGISTPFHLAANIYCALKWKYDAHEARRIWKDFSEALQDDSAFLILDQLKKPSPKKDKPSPKPQPKKGKK